MPKKPYFLMSFFTDRTTFQTHRSHTGCSLTDMFFLYIYSLEKNNFNLFTNNQSNSLPGLDWFTFHTLEKMKGLPFINVG